MPYTYNGRPTNNWGVTQQTDTGTGNYGKTMSLTTNNGVTQYKNNITGTKRYGINTPGGTNYIGGADNQNAMKNIYNNTYNSGDTGSGGGGYNDAGSGGGGNDYLKMLEDYWDKYSKGVIDAAEKNRDVAKADAGEGWKKTIRGINKDTHMNLKRMKSVGPGDMPGYWSNYIATMNSGRGQRADVTNDYNKTLSQIDLDYANTINNLNKEKFNAVYGPLLQYEMYKSMQ